MRPRTDTQTETTCAQAATDRPAGGPSNTGPTAMAQMRCLVLLLCYFSTVCHWSFTALRHCQRREKRIVLRVRERRQGSPRRKSDDAYTSTKAITSRVKNAVSATQVLAIMDLEHESPNMDLIAISAAWTSLAKLQRSINTEVAASPSFSMLLRLTHMFLQRPVGLALSGEYALGNGEASGSLPRGHLVEKLGRCCQYHCERHE